MIITLVASPMNGFLIRMSLFSISYFPYIKPSNYIVISDHRDWRSTHITAAEIAHRFYRFLEIPTCHKEC